MSVSLFPASLSSSPPPLHPFSFFLSSNVLDFRYNDPASSTCSSCSSSRFRSHNLPLSLSRDIPTFESRCTRQLRPIGCNSFPRFYTEHFSNFDLADANESERRESGNRFTAAWEKEDTIARRTNSFPAKSRSTSFFWGPASIRTHFTAFFALTPINVSVERSWILEGLFS